MQPFYSQLSHSPQLANDLATVSEELLHTRMHQECSLEKEVGMPGHSGIRLDLA